MPSPTPSAAPVSSAPASAGTRQSARVDPTADAEAMGALTELSRIAEQDLPPELAQLVGLHVSQLNGCAYCTSLHREGALAAGHPPAKLAALPDWPDAPGFTPAERAALALAEQLTRPAGGAVPSSVHAEAADLLGEGVVSRLIWTVAAVNAWNRVGIAAAAPAR